MENTNKSIENKERQIEEIKQDNITLNESIKEIEEKINQIKEDVKTSGSKIEQVKQDRINKNELLNTKEQEINDKFKVIEDLKSQIVKIDVKKTKIEDDINDIINKMWEEYELTPNNVIDYKKPDNVSATQKKVNSLRKELKELRKCKYRCNRRI